MEARRHLIRLQRVFVTDAVYFITVCTKHRRTILAQESSATILRAEWSNALGRHGWLIGRYTIMPDHVHFFCAEKSGGAMRNLSAFIGFWKEWTSKGLIGVGLLSTPVWQQGFFDHVLRSTESYSEKWAYVRENPVRACLVERWEDWPWQGFVDFDAPSGLS